jgi:hypothetical protein
MATNTADAIGTATATISIASKTLLGLLLLSLLRL